MFQCKKCGSCCSNVNLSPLYADLDRGDGKCRYFDDKLRLCKIYLNRPLKCNVDETYNAYFRDKMSRSDFYKLNYEACIKLQQKDLEE